MKFFIILILIVNHDSMQNLKKNIDSLALSHWNCQLSKITDARTHILGNLLQWIG